MKNLTKRISRQIGVKSWNLMRFIAPAEAKWTDDWFIPFFLIYLFSFPSSIKLRYAEDVFLALALFTFQVLSFQNHRKKMKTIWSDFNRFTAAQVFIPWDWKVLIQQSPHGWHFISVRTHSLNWMSEALTHAPPWVCLPGFSHLCVDLHSGALDGALPLQGVKR